MIKDQAESLRRNNPRRQDRTLDPRESKRARKIAVTSGKGGVGKSNVSLNLSLAIGRLSQKVLLVDADTNLANIDILLGIKIQKTLADVVFGNQFFGDVLTNGPEGLQILPGSSGVVGLMENDEAAREKLFLGFEEFERQFDVILIDTGAGVSENVLSFVASADDVVLVTNSEPTSITDAYAMVKLTINRNPNAKIHILVNLAANRAQALDTFEKLQLAVRNFLHYELQMIGFLPVDPNIPAAVAHQEPFLTLYPRCAASNSMMMMARKLLKAPPLEANRGSMLKRIFQQKD